MSLEESSARIREWFRIHHRAGLVLPDGWFGKPRDNLHQLDSAEASEQCLSVSLDEGALLLTFRGEVAVKEQGIQLLISGFSSLKFRQIEYGSNSKVHHFEYPNGEVVFENFVAAIEAAADAAVSEPPVAPLVWILNLFARVR